MKRFTMLMLACLFVFGCSTPASQTTPTDARSEDRNLETPKKPTEDNNLEQGGAKDEPQPEVSGYGSDPGEDTQE